MLNKGRLFPALALLVFMVGCTAKNPNAPASVTGKVTYKDKVLTAGTVTYYTKAGVYGPAAININGTYTISDLPAGDAEVTVETESANKSTPKPSYGGKKGGAGSGMSPAPPGYTPPPTGEYVKIPAKYAAQGTSPLKATLTAGKQTKDFTITD
jgi:hypothetical protein